MLACVDHYAQDYHNAVQSKHTKYFRDIFKRFAFPSILQVLNKTHQFLIEILRLLLHFGSFIKSRHVQYQSSVTKDFSEENKPRTWCRISNTKQKHVKPGSMESLKYPKSKETEINLLLQVLMVELRRLRERKEVSILNQSPKRVSLRGRSKACYLRWCPGSRVGATECVPADGHHCPIYTRACRWCLRQWAPWNLLRHWSGSWMSEGGNERKGEGPTSGDSLRELLRA